MNLCKDCSNNDSEYFLVGTHYEEKEICIYSKPEFPNANQCVLYESKMLDLEG